MNWWLVGGALAAVAGGVWLYAARLPETVTITRDAVVQAPVERVFALVTDVAGQDRWRGDVGAVSMEDDGRRWTEHGKAGAIRFETIARVPNELFDIGYTSDRGFEGRWTGTFAPHGPGATRVSLIERTTIRGPLNRLLARIVSPPGEHADRYLADLERAFSPMD